MGDCQEHDRGLKTRDLARIAWFVVLLAGCKFQSDIQPLELATAPPQPFGAFAPDEQELEELDQTPAALSRTFGDITSADAIARCEGRELAGDEQVGACLAPGGDAYYVWINPDDVRLVDRNNPHLVSFRFSALNRHLSQETVAEKLQELPKLGLVLFDTLGVGVTCGGAIATALTGGGIPASVVLGGGCAYLAYRFSMDSVGISFNAKDFSEALIASWQHESDAEYNLCRMDGGSDANCRQTGEGG
jgi:hypothetical protein